MSGSDTQLHLTVEELNLVISFVKNGGLQGRADALREALALQASALSKLESELKRKSENRHAKR